MQGKPPSSLEDCQRTRVQFLLLQCIITAFLNKVKQRPIQTLGVLIFFGVVFQMASVLQSGYNCCLSIAVLPGEVNDFPKDGHVENSKVEGS